MKKIISVLLLLLLQDFAYSFDGKIKLDKDEIDINTKVTLTIDITGSSNARVKKIKGLEKFNVVKKYESKSLSSNVFMINGMIKNETKTSYSINLLLKPKEPGEFIIGPAEIEEDGKVITTNSLKIKVYQNKVSLPGQDLSNLNSSLNLLDKLDINLDKIFGDMFKNNDMFENINPSLEEVKKLSDGNYEKKASNKEYLLYILVFILILLIVIIIHISRRDKIQLLEKIKKLELKAKEGKEDKTNLIYEKDNYPKADDKHFLEEIEKIFKLKLEELTRANLESKDYSEILSNYDFGEKKAIVKDIVSLLYTLKYSQKHVDKEKLIQLIKEL